MIGKLKGIIDSVATDSLLLDVGGVCYLVFCSGNCLASIPANGEAAELLIETHVREDHIHLYGFTDEKEKEVFNLLTAVQGVGNRVGLAILSVLKADEAISAIAAQDKTAFTRASGVGPKLAGRIVAELKDKVGSFTSDNSAISNVNFNDDNMANDAISALVNLGYNRIAAVATVSEALKEQGADADLQSVITYSLKKIS
jgi:Holliday junction DNA helicase RuvA